MASGVQAHTGSGAPRRSFATVPVSTFFLSATVAQPLTITDHVVGANRHDGNKAIRPVLWPGGTGKDCC